VGQPTRQTVKHCGQCPMFDGIYQVCQFAHRGLLDGEGDPDEDPPPLWCPLRGGDILIRLDGPLRSADTGNAYTDDPVEKG
jgi:hypothetical protein